jgi:cystathionine beta-lyase
MATEEGLLVGISSRSRGVGGDGSRAAAAERRQADRGRSSPHSVSATCPLHSSPTSKSEDVLPMRPVSHFSFDQLIDRRGGDSIKWNRYAGRDVLPLWVADMDFAAPPAIISALEKRVAHGCFGYAEATPLLLEAVLGHLQRAYGWQVEANWLVWLPGLVSALNVACRAVDGDVLTATPIYPPFLSAPGLAGKELATAALQQRAGRWVWDFPALQRALTPNSRLLLVCHPHNPVGRAWDDDELEQIAAFCERHQLIVCSDEIHCQLLLDRQRRHRPLAMIGADIAERSITLMAPSKTYNIPGLGALLRSSRTPRYGVASQPPCAVLSRM